ncbi:MAG: PhzF family phenazine biosynthesis protein [Acidobacteriota bacterium]
MVDRAISPRASRTTSGALACYLLRQGLVSPDQSEEIKVQVEQGIEMGRPSQIEVRLWLSNDIIKRVCVRGHAVCVLKGEYELFWRVQMPSFSTDSVLDLVKKKC